MNIEIQKTDEQVELIKACASRNKAVAEEARATVAELMSFTIAEVINLAPTLSNLFTKLEYNDDDNPSIPLDNFKDISDDGFLNIWSASDAGGLPSNHNVPLASELKFAPYVLNSAISFDRKFAAKSRLDVVGDYFTRMAEEIIIQQDQYSSTLIMGTLADAGRDTSATSTDNSNHTLISDANNVFGLHQFNRLMTRMKRVNSAWNGGTPTVRNRRVTDILISPEITEEIRKISYNPVNIAGPLNTTAAADSGVIAAPEDMRQALFNAGGLPEFYGITLTELNELGPSAIFTNVYNTVKGGFSSGKDDLVVALDRSRKMFLRPVAVDSEIGSEFVLQADDQFLSRSKKIGWYGEIEEGRSIIENRGLLGMEV
jgi:hypothetical protein